VQHFLESRYDQFIADLETIVNIDSGSELPEGLAAVRAFFDDRFSRIGWRTRKHDFSGARVPCLEVTTPNVNQPDAPLDFLFLGHMDTVFPAGTVASRGFSINGDRAMGPGVCDMKGGLVTMLHVAETMTRLKLLGDVSIGMAFNSDEEVGSRGSRKWFEDMAKRSKRVLVFEPCRATGHRILHRKGGGGYTVSCHGRAAHAGAAPEKGANAVVELAHQVLKIADLARLDLGTTVSVTTLSGGTADNVIPDFAKAEVDVRYAVIEEAGRIQQAFEQLPDNTSVEGVQVRVKGELSRVPMVPSEKTQQLWDRMAAIGENLGMEMKLTTTGGCSDGNFTATLGVPTIDAMGPMGGDAHSPEEYLELGSIVPNIRLICEVIRAAAAGSLP
jgi:glutamate carboxypeptidase